MILMIISLFMLTQSSEGQKRIKQSIDLVPVKESYLLSGKPDSLQYFYFLNGILKDQFDARRKNLYRMLQSKEDLVSYQNRIKAEYLKMLGSLPEKTPLNPIITGKIKKKNYTVEKVAFESRPDHHVTALLYLPEGKGPFPGILHMPGHSLTSKGRDYYQTIGRCFAMNGFVVLQIDPVCQGERCQICQNDSVRSIDNSGTPVDQSTTDQHELYNEKLMLLGSGMVAWEVWDHIRSIDYLCSRPEVDAGKIGITGLSGGGTQTTYLVSLDSRIKAAVPSSYIATTEEKFRTIGSQDGCQQLSAEGKRGIEEQDFLFMAAPTPVLILSTYGDFFPYKGSLTASHELKEMYRVLGLEGRVRQFAAPGEHGMPGISLEADVRWMSWWLRGDSSNIVHDTLTNDFIPLKDTYVTESGQVLSWFKNEKSISDYSLMMLEKCRQSRERFLSQCSYDKLAAKTAELIGYENIDDIKGGSFPGTFNWEGLTIEKHLIIRDRGFKLPALIIKPKKFAKEGAPAIILSGCFGKMNELTRNKQFVMEKLKEGYVVMIVDVSNTGELRSNKKVSGSGVGYEFAVAKMCVYAGRTLLGYRAEDLNIAKNYLMTVLKINNKVIELLASEQIGPSAVHASFIDKGYSKLYLLNSLDSWETFVKSHFMPDNTGIIVPDVLNYYDLPDLIKIMPKTRVEIL